MPQLGIAEIFVILVVALIVFGPTRIPEIARQVGRFLADLRDLQENLRGQVQEVMSELDPRNAADSTPGTGAPAPEPDDHEPPALPPPDEPSAPAVVPLDADGNPVDLPDLGFPPATGGPVTPGAPSRPPSRFRAPKSTSQPPKPRVPHEPTAAAGTPKVAPRRFRPPAPPSPN